MHRRAIAIFHSLLFLVAPALCQDILQSAPPCAHNCAPLTQQAYVCTPAGGQPVTNFATYKGCFCSAESGPMLGDVATYCAYNCTTPQFNDLSSWFRMFCGQDLGLTPAAGASTTVASPTINPAASSPTSIVPSTTHHVRPHATKTGPVVVTGGATTGLSASDIPVVGSVSTGKKNQSWWAGHYQWIVMVIVLVIGFSIIIGAGIYFKRRYNRRQNAASELPSNAAWAPDTSQFRSSSVYGGEESGEMAREKSISSTRAIQERSGRSKRFSAG